MSQQRPRIICIGPNKSGTTSLHHFFAGNGLRSVHHGGPDRRANIAHVMLRNASVARPLLTGLERFDALSDITFNDNRLSIDAAVFPERLMEEYPDACFIDNHRPRDPWVQSRARHFGGRVLNRACRSYGTTEAEVLDMWAAYHTAHGEKVRRAAAACGTKLLDFPRQRGRPRADRRIPAPRLRSGHVVLEQGQYRRDLHLEGLGAADEGAIHLTGSKPRGLPPHGHLAARTGKLTPGS